MNNMTNWLFVYCCLNCIAFLLFAVDKLRAQGGRWRTSEHTLLWATFLGGVGAFAARRLTRHKTHKEPFRTQFRVVAVLHVVAAAISLPAVWPHVISRFIAT
jgi:uncharacterized membrane protein YsdA (DUF1294 family)